MKLYAIKDWSKHFENSRSRSVERLHWVPIPCRHDGENFRRMMAHKNGAEIFGCWVLIIQVAAKCQARGTLLKGDGKPHSAESLALKTGARVESMKSALEFLELHTDWLDVQHVTDGRQATVSQVSGDCQPTGARVYIEERRGEEITENREERNESAGSPPSSIEALLSELEASAAYSGINVRIEFSKCDLWCKTNKRQLTKRRLLNWLNRIDRPLNGVHDDSQKYANGNRSIKTPVGTPIDEMEMPFA